MNPTLLRCLLLAMLVSAWIPRGAVGRGERPGGARAAGGAAPPAARIEKRWLYLSSNLYRDRNIPVIEDILRRASAAGYNGVLFSDVKTLSWRRLDEPQRYRANAAKLRALTRELGLELAVAVFPFGWAESYLALDPDLAAGVPVRRAPLVRRGDELVPEPTAAVGNGSFEIASGHRADGFSLQDRPGKLSFIDTAQVKSGGASMRFDFAGAADRHGHGRIFQKVKVRPWQQYRIRVWLKARDLTADIVQVVALDGKRPLQYQCLVGRGPEGPSYFYEASGLTTDWIEQTVAFNSLENTSVTIGAGVWGGRGGTIWWDDLRIEAAPVLNVLRREGLPLRVERGDGAECREGLDFGRVVDTLLGVSRWPGTFDTRHEQPRIGVPPGSGIGEGERVYLSCYHPVIFYSGQTACSLDDPGVFDMCAEEIRSVNEILSPDYWFMSHDEIRCAGWEPSQIEKYRSAGELLAFNIEKCCEIAFREGGGKPLCVWSDMFDPYHNARPSYYLVNGSLAKSWEGLDRRVIVMKWGMPDEAGKSMRFFAGRGHRMMIAAYYDGDVPENHGAWSRASAGTPGIEGVMYTTWRHDYSKLEEFAETWWGGTK